MTTSRPSVSTLLSITETHSQLAAGQNYTPTIPWMTSDGVVVTQKTLMTGVTTEVTRLIEGTPSGTSPNLTQKATSEVSYNGTGYYIEAEEEPGLNDWQTLFLACVITLICLVLILLLAFGVRFVWKKYRKCKHNSQYDGIIRREGTSESLSRPLHSHLTDKSCEETHLMIRTDDIDCRPNTDLTTQSSQMRTNNHSNTNGSIITMTLKNNHLIVETEERNDIEEDSRETKVYLPEAKDGVFVVEVQQGSRRSPSSANTALCAAPDLPEVSVSSLSDQCALVHNPPDRYSDEETLEDGEDSEYCVETASSSNPTEMLICRMTRTGLTQSNSSLSHPSYSYTTQQAYGLSSYGYAIEGSKRSDTKPPIEEDTKPKITAAVYKSSLKRSPSNEDLHLASMNGVVDKKVEGGCCNRKQVDSLSSLVEEINFDVSSGVN